MSLWTLDKRVVLGQEGYPTGTLLYYCKFLNHWNQYGWSNYVATEVSFCISYLPCGNAPQWVTISETILYIELLSLIRIPLSSTEIVDLVFSNTPKPYFIVLSSWCISQLTYSSSSEKYLATLVAEFVVLLATVLELLGKSKW